MMTDLPVAKTRPASNWSAIWILPLLALVIGGWLAWQSYSQSGTSIQVFFETGEGVVAGKTEVIYKGMPIGKVVKLELDDTGSRRGVNVTLEMHNSFEDHLRTGTRFWLVKPSVGLGGITGLETLVSGNYIAVSPGPGEPSKQFEALRDEPPIADTQPGLHLTLKAERLGSLNRDSPVFYRQIKVGRVKSYSLAADQTTVEIKVFIEPEYASLVRKHTRFWNASGFTVDASLSGVKVRSESLTSVVAGGITFATPESRKDSPPTDPSLPFKLYEDFDSAQAGIRASIILSDFDGLTAGRTPVMYKGIQVGMLKTLKIEPDLSKAVAEVVIDPLAEDYLVDGAEFWVVKPSISLAGITGLEALVKGNYIAMRPGEKNHAPLREFVARAKAPPLDLKAAGLHLVLLSDNLGSLEVGSPVLYRKMKVGSVQSYQLGRDRRRVVLGIHIEPDYANLVNSSTRFWNASGITLSGGLSGIEVKSDSLQSLLAGGVAFETPDLKAPLEQNIPRFTLYPDREQAFLGGQTIRLHVARGDGLKRGTPIRFRGLEMGQVESVELAGDLQGVVLHARINEAAKRIAARGARFWLVKPELGLVRTANLETLVTGQYLEVLPAPVGAPPQYEFTLVDQAPGPDAREQGLKLVLSAPRRGSIKVGVPVTYKDIPVGSVTGFKLGPNADRVLLDILIQPRYAALVHSGSRFWNSSGFGFDFGLIKGAKLRTESLETLIEGGVAFATPEGEGMGKPALPGQTFPMFEEARDEWLQWSPKIPLKP
jgi:paraquat-inducible protein B